MTLEEYFEKLDQIRKDYYGSLEVLRQTYVTQNAAYQIGDIVKDHLGAILVEKFQ